MARGKRIDNDTRVSIIKYHSTGCKVALIAKKLRLKWSSVKSIINHYEKKHQIAPMKSSGRPRKTTPREDRIIINHAISNRRITLESLGKEVRNSDLISVSDTTIKRRLHEVKLRGCAARKKPLLMKRHLGARLSWCKEKANWTQKEWSNVIWSDESKFCLIGSRGTQRVWRRPGEALKSECLTATVKHGGGKKLTIIA